MKRRISIWPTAYVHGIADRGGVGGEGYGEVGTRDKSEFVANSRCYVRCYVGGRGGEGAYIEDV